MAENVAQAKKIVIYCYEVISDDLRKHFYHKLQESLPVTRLGLLESRRVLLPSYSYSRVSKCLKSARQLAIKVRTLWLKSVQWNVLHGCTSCVCNNWTAGFWCNN